MTVLILGATGMLGKALKAAFEEAGYTVYGLSSVDCDFTDVAQIETLAERYPQCKYVINAAAYTKVDQAEQEQALANQVNGEAVGVLANVAQKMGAVFVHFSTDYVFDGTQKEAYREDDSCAPVNAYGYSKWLGEDACQKACKDYYIFRVQWLYGTGGSHFVGTMRQLMSSKDRLEIVDDQYGSLSYAPALAHYVLAALTQSVPYGVYHCTDKGVGSWYDVACLIAKHIGYEGTLTPVASAAFPRPAKRPLNGRMNCQKFDEAVGMPRESWQNNLERYLAGEQYGN